MNEILTNTVSVSSHITPQAVAYDFKQWAGVIGMICTSIYAAFHLVFPKVQAFLDERDGGFFRGFFVWLFGEPKSDLADKIEAIPDSMPSCDVQFRMGCQAAARLVRGQLLGNAEQLKPMSIPAESHTRQSAEPTPWPSLSGANQPGKEQVTVSAAGPVVQSSAG